MRRFLELEAQLGIEAVPAHPADGAGQRQAGVRAGILGQVVPDLPEGRRVADPLELSQLGHPGGTEPVGQHLADSAQILEVVAHRPSVLPGR